MAMSTHSLLTEDAVVEHLRRAVSIADLDVDVVAPQDRQVIAGAIRLHYLDWGEAPGPTLVFLHGVGLTAHTWDIPCLALRPQYRCLALDLRGHGDSEWSPELDYSLNAQVGDIQCLVESLQLDRFILVGMSLGGLVSLGYASRHPDELKGLVVVDSSLRVRSRSRVRDFLALDPEMPSVDDFVERARSFNSRRRPELLRISLLHNLRQLPNGNYAWKYDHRYWGNIDLERLRADRRAVAAGLPAITCPTLVIRGAESDVLLDADAEEFARELPHGQWTKVTDAGHTVQGDNPRGLIDALLPFLAEIAKA